MRGVLSYALACAVLAACLHADARAGESRFDPAAMCRVIHTDIAAYLATGHPCPCPYNLKRNGAPCGRVSAWAKPGGAAPRCYFDDVTGARPPNFRGGRQRESWPPPPNC